MIALTKRMYGNVDNLKYKEYTKTTLCRENCYNYNNYFQTFGLYTIHFPYEKTNDKILNFKRKIFSKNIIFYDKTLNLNNLITVYLNNNKPKINFLREKHYGNHVILLFFTDKELKHRKREYEEFTTDIYVDLEFCNNPKCTIDREKLYFISEEDHRFLLNKNDSRNVAEDDSDF